MVLCRRCGVGGDVWIGCNDEGVLMMLWGWCCVDDGVFGDVV